MILRKTNGDSRPFTAILHTGILPSMPRTARVAPGGIIYHVLNRAVGRTRIFRTRKDYEAFQRCLVDTLDVTPMRVLGYCIMPNHWHLILWPERDGDLARFMMRLTNTHVRRWLTAHEQVGTGHLYQGRYKSFAMQDDGHLETVDRYVHRNALRAGMVARAELWPYSGIGQSLLAEALRVPLTELPIPRRRNWMEWLNQPQTAAEEDAIRRCIRQSRPFGDESWLKRTMKRLGWCEPGHPGRPRKQKKR
jgi:putative transposase